jgi:DNA-binding NarL/FixJ family response regulator
MQNVRILLVEDHPVVRRGIAQLLAEEPDMEVCGEAESVDEALNVLARDVPDVALIDLSLRDSNGLDLLKALKESYPAVVSLVVSMHAEVGYVEKALRAGAKGYVTKDQADEVIIEAIRKAHRGGLYIQPSLSEEVLQRLVQGPEQSVSDRIGALSDRERAVFLMMGEGKDTKEIAAALGLNLKTVETYRRRIRTKLDIHSTSKLTHAAFEYIAEQDLG